jgi:hypothetical protein
LKQLPSILDTKVLLTSFADELLNVWLVGFTLGIVPRQFIVDFAASAPEYIAILGRPEADSDEYKRIVHRFIAISWMVDRGLVQRQEIACDPQTLSRHGFNYLVEKPRCKTMRIDNNNPFFAHLCGHPFHHQPYMATVASVQCVFTTAVLRMSPKLFERACKACRGYCHGYGKSCCDFRPLAIAFGYIDVAHRLNGFSYTYLERQESAKRLECIMKNQPQFKWTTAQVRLLLDWFADEMDDSLAFLKNQSFLTCAEKLKSSK